MAKPADISPLRSAKPLDVSQYGARAARLSAMSSRGIRVPNGVALSTQLIENISQNGTDGIRNRLIESLGTLVDRGPLVVRGSPGDSSWGGPAVVTDVVGINALLDVIVSMVEAWSRPTALILRNASGAPEDAGLGLVIHEMVQGGQTKSPCGSAGCRGSGRSRYHHTR